MEETLQALSQLRAALAQDSCLPKAPLIALEPNATPPLLRYNLPMSSHFSAYGNILMDIPIDKFSTAATTISGNYFDATEGMTEEEIIVYNEENPDAVPGASHYPHGHPPPPLEPNEFPDSSGGNLRINTNIAGSNPTTTALTTEEIATLAAKGFMPYQFWRFGRYEIATKLIKKPATVVPRLFLIEEYRVSNFMGDFGAGKAISNISLLPGEKTTIAIRTFKNSAYTRAYSENVLDSFGSSSAAEMENLVEEENSTATIKTNTVGKTTGLSLSTGSAVTKLCGSFNFGKNKTKTSSRSANTRQLNKALSKHVETSNSNRNITVNTSTTESITEGYESSTTRVLENPNKSRTLNFVCRQLQQEYISLTYLANVRIAFTNGYSEYLRVVEIEELDDLLEELILPAEQQWVREQLLKHYCTIQNWRNDEIPFIEHVTRNIGSCVLATAETESYYRKRRDCKDTYVYGGRNFTVDGPILAAERHVLHTDALITDCILGNGEALDCYNQKLQDAATIEAGLDNLKIMQQLALIESLSSPQEKLEALTRLQGSCCGNVLDALKHIAATILPLISNNGTPIVPENPTT